MSTYEIVRVVHAHKKHEDMLGFSIDVPKPGYGTNKQTLEVIGWAIARGDTIDQINVLSNGKIVGSTSEFYYRSDVQETYSTVTSVKNSGFRVSIDLIAIPGNFVLEIQAILKNGNRNSIAEIHGTQQESHVGFKPSINPIMVTSLGRSGSTVLMDLLSEHPEIVVHKNYPYETRSASYWMHMLTVLSKPANWTESADIHQFHTNPWWVGCHPFNLPNLESLSNWFSTIYHDDLVSFCQISAEKFYNEVSRLQKQSNPVYYAEKSLVDGNIQRKMWEVYDNPREIILVRDFRDIVCSIFAFNKKRGYSDFGRQQVNTDEDYVRFLREGPVQSLLDNYKERQSQVMVVRYEDIILNPKPTLSNMFIYLGLENNIEMLDGILKRVSEDKTQLQLHQTTSNPTNSIGRWKNDLDSSLILLCNDIFSDALKEFGYIDGGI